MDFYEFAYSSRLVRKISFSFPIISKIYAWFLKLSGVSPDGIYITNLPAVILSQDQALFQAPQFHSSTHPQQVVYTKQSINQPIPVGLQPEKQLLKLDIYSQ
jgi:hypothetical protein